MRRIAALALLFCTWSFGAEPGANPPSVSIIQLISAPEHFNRKAVTVVGFLLAQKERTMLFLGSEDAKQYIPLNGLWLNPDSRLSEELDKLDSNYVLVVGTFIATRPDSVHLCSGEIRDIVKVQRWSKP